jgi:hypothetical protein
MRFICLNGFEIRFRCKENLRAIITEAFEGYLGGRLIAQLDTRCKKYAAGLQQTDP